MNFDTKLEDYIQIPSLTKQYCFGCSQNNTHGLRLKFFTDMEKLFTRLVIPEHLVGWGKLSHGGVLATILDETMAWSTIYLLKKFILTKNMMVDFIRPVQIQEEIFVFGEIAEHKTKSEVLVKSKILNKENKLCTTAQANIKLFDSNDARKFGFIQEDAIVELENLIFKKKE